MTPPAAQANGTTEIKLTSRQKDFEAITITGYYTRDIRFPVSTSQWRASILLINRIDLSAR